MKQVLIDQRDGRVFVDEVPPPVADDHSVLIAVEASIISSGTERAKVEMGERSLLEKARSRPDLVRQVVANAQRDGIRATANLVRERLSTPQPLGYSAAGRVLEVGRLVEGVRPGQLVACGGAGYANHAEVVAVPWTLVAPVPEGVSPQDAAFATVGAIALHGIRQARLTAGELVVVAGLGLIGQLAVRLLLAYGHPVIGVDPSEAARADIEALGCDAYAPDNAALGQLLADAVLLTAATPSSDLVAAAPTWCRDRPRVVVVGDVGLDVPRAPYYELEADLRFSRSYGPGRYDPSYEERGNDYPIGFVRWTEQRNLAEVLRLLATDRFRVADLVSESYTVDDAPAAYARLASAERTLALMLTYAGTSSPQRRIQIRDSEPKPVAQQQQLDHITLDVIGAGNFATRTLLPLLKADPRISFGTVVTASGTRASHVAKQYGFADASSDAEGVAARSDGDTVIIATRHSSHARLAALAAASGKAVFLEKPLAITFEELEMLGEVDGRERIMVGFNRRFAPATNALCLAMAERRGPAHLLIRISAGHLPRDHWLMDPAEGGRIVGEVCHFVDLALHLVGSDVVDVTAHGAGDRPLLEDQLVATLEFADGSAATILYLSSGGPSLPKEYIEAHWDSQSVVIDDFRTWVAVDGKRRKGGSRKQDKGHEVEVARFLGWVRGHGRIPVPFTESLKATDATLRIARTLTSASAGIRDGDYPPDLTGSRAGKRDAG